LPNLELNINSNLGVKTILVERLAEKVEKLRLENKIRSFKLFTSLDTWGNQAEYIRTGLDLDVWKKNFHTYMTRTSYPLTFMITFNILSVPNFKSLLSKILAWRRVYKRYAEQDVHRIRFDTPYLKEPLQYDMNILPKDEFMPYMNSALEYIKNNISPDKFTEIEYEKFRRVVSYMETTTYPEGKLAEGRKDFYAWFSEHDRRRGTNFTQTFPELNNFFELCKNV
jgi:hypothetical protein